MQVWLRGVGGGGGCFYFEKATRHWEYWRVLCFTDWRLVSFFLSFSGMHICSEVYSCVSETQKGYDGQNRYMDWTELLYGWNMSCKSARSHSLSEVDFVYNVKGWNIWFVILICPHQERWERDRMGCIWGIYEWNISFKYAHSQSLIWVMIPIQSEYILLYVNVFMPSKKSCCIDLLISLKFPRVCMYVYAYARVSMQCGEYEGTQTIVRLICWHGKRWVKKFLCPLFRTMPHGHNTFGNATEEVKWGHWAWQFRWVVLKGKVTGLDS